MSILDDTRTAPRAVRRPSSALIAQAGAYLVFAAALGFTGAMVFGLIP